MKNLIPILLLALSLSLAACNGGGSGGGRGPNKPGAEEPGGRGGEDIGGGDEAPVPQAHRECAAEVIVNCGLFNLSDAELMRIREQIVVVIPADITPENHPGMKIVIARVLVLVDFIGEYYKNAKMELSNDMQDHYVAYYQSIKWK